MNIRNIEKLFPINTISEKIYEIEKKNLKNLILEKSFNLKKKVNYCVLKYCEKI